MNVIPLLASSLGRNDERPNIALAEALVANKDGSGVRELVALLNGKNRALRSDALKTLYEIGGRVPEMIAPFAEVFKDLLAGPDNRMVWGAMCAIDAIAGVKPDAVHAMLPRIMQAVDNGTVITRDHAVKALVKLAAQERFSGTVIPLLLEQLRTAPVNQLPMYAELACPAVAGKNALDTAAILEARLAHIGQPAKRKRIEKALKRLRKK